MSERKVLNKYYPPDFDPSKIPRAKCPRNRQFTVRLMVPCNIKCYTCGEYVAKGKKFNARKEDVENMTYLGVRIYRFYIKCPGCLAEISFRTDPESTDYVIEAGAHRNFQALKLAEEQAEREEREAKEEIESNPMLLLENRTQQSQYEMEVLESLEDLRDMNERHAGIDLGKITDRYEAERKMTEEQREEAEKLEALKALGYEMIEGQMVKRIVSDELSDSPPAKKLKASVETIDKPPQIAPSEKYNSVLKKNTMKSKMAGLIKPKIEQKLPNTVNEGKAPSTSNGLDTSCAVEKSNKGFSASTSAQNSNMSSKDVKNDNIKEDPSTSSPDTTNSQSALVQGLSSSSLTAIMSVKPKGFEAPAPKGPSGLSFIGAYSDSESSDDAS